MLVNEMARNNKIKVMENRTIAERRSDTNIRTMSQTKMNNQTMKKSKYERNFNFTFRIHFCLTILILSLLSTSSFIFIPKATASSEIENSSGITTPISNEISNKQVKAEKIQSSSQSNQSDHSSTTLHPGESTKLSTSDESQLKTTEAKPRSSHETKPSSPAPDKREDLTALKALDVLLRKYDRRSTPTNDLGVATNVSCQLFVASMSSINTDHMDYMADTYLRQRWEDPRLSHSDIKVPLDLADPRLVKAIWKPEIFFPNAKEADFQFVTVPNVLIRIHPNGEILYILRLRLKFSCMMELSKFPLDTQICKMQISSFSKTTKELLLSWDNGKIHEDPVTVARDLRLPQFEMQKITTNRCHETNHMGNYSCLVAEFHLHRSIGYHLIQSYLPSILIVAISWVSFWMDIDCVPARVTLGVITLLTVSGLVSGEKGGIPQTSYVKAIDVWMGVCTAFVFAALVEFTFVNYMWRSPSISEGKRKNYAERQMMEKRRQIQLARKSNPNNSFFPCLERQDSSIELNMEACGANLDLHPLSSRQSHTTNLNAPHNGRCTMNTTGTMTPGSPPTNLNGNCEESLGKEVDEGGYRKEGQNSIYRGNQCSFEGTIPETVDTAHVDIANINLGNMFDGETMFRPLVEMRTHHLKARAVFIDECCRFAFPLGFVVFNIFYWFYYQVYRQDEVYADTLN